jgi:hypothetical protein
MPRAKMSMGVSDRPWSPVTRASPPFCSRVYCTKLSRYVEQIWCICARAGSSTSAHADVGEFRLCILMQSSISIRD